MKLWTHWWKTLPFKWSLTFTIFSIKDLNYNMKNLSDNQCNKVGNLPIPEFIYTVCISYQPSVFSGQKNWIVEIAILLLIRKSREQPPKIFKNVSKIVFIVKKSIWLRLISFSPLWLNQLIKFDLLFHLNCDGKIMV